jgi:glucose/arabinose dehydrogenase
MRRILLIAVMLHAAAGYAYEFDYEYIASGLNHPTSLVFLDSSTALVTERNGALRYLRSGVLDPQEISGVPVVFVAGQAGLFDVVADPEFSRNNRIYLAYAQGEPKANTLKIASATLVNHQLQGVKVIFEAQPLRASAFHYGGRMVFLGDGTLLFSCGEGFEYREQAQSLGSHFGKTLRINKDGSVPGDNPFVGRKDARGEIYSYGHRNPQGLVLAPDNSIYLHEHGPRGGDELNLVEAALNYGWPAITWGVDYSGAHVSPYSAYPGLEQPLLYWTPSIAPAGMAYYDGDEFPEWRGNLLVAALMEQSVRRIVLEGHTVASQESLFTDLGRRLRDVRVGPNGALYLLTDYADGEIIRVTAKD